MAEARWEARETDHARYMVSWKGREGKTRAAEVHGRDISTSGIGFECPYELPTGAIVRLRSLEGAFRWERECEVIHCVVRGEAFQVGCEFRDERTQDRPASGSSRTEAEPDYYEMLQISRKADAQTIHRVFRIMAARFHPDNPQTGDVEQFLRMKRAYAVLSEPGRRAEYDARLERETESGPRPIFALKDFVTGVEAEANRRLGVLALLYKKRQTSPESPHVSLLDLEREMGFPREYLSFTLWYLRAKDMVTMADNSDFELTAAGADFVEKKAVRSEIVNQLLNQGPARFQQSATTPLSGNGNHPVRREKPSQRRLPSAL